MATVFLSLTEFMFKVALQVLKHAYTKVCSVLLKKQSYIQLCYKVEKHFLGYSEGTSLQYCKHAHCHPSKHIQFLSKQGMYNKNNKKDTISQLVIHKIKGAGRVLQGIIKSKPLLKHFAEVDIQILNASREGDSTTSGQHIQMLCHSLLSVKFFLIFVWSFLCYSFCLLPLILSLNTCKGLSPIHLTSTL